MIECQIYGGPMDGLEIVLDDEEFGPVAYWIDAPRSAYIITQQPDLIIERMKMINPDVYEMTAQPRGDIMILSWFDRVKRE